MIKLTKHEQLVLAVLFNSAKGNGHDFGFTSDAVKSLKATYNAEAVGALITSLQKKGVITVHDPVTTNAGTRHASTYTQFTWALEVSAVSALLPTETKKTKRPDPLDVRTWAKTGAKTADGLDVLINPATNLDCVASRWGLYSPAAYEMEIKRHEQERAGDLAAAVHALMDCMTQTPRGGLFVVEGGRNADYNAAMLRLKHLAADLPRR